MWSRACQPAIMLAQRPARGDPGAPLFPGRQESALKQEDRPPRCDPKEGCDGLRAGEAIGGDIQIVHATIDP